MKRILVLSIVTLFPGNIFAQSEFIEPALLISPFNNEPHRGIVNQLIWHRVENAAAYKVQVSLTPDFSSLFYQSDVLTDTTFNVQTISFSTTYYWRVYSFSGAAVGVYSDVWHFSTADLIGVSSEEQESLMSISNYPKPFSSLTTIKYSLSKPGVVSISIFDLLGHQVVVLAPIFNNAGNSSLPFDASFLSNGAYILKLETEGKIYSHIVQIIK